MGQVGSLVFWEENARIKNKDEISSKKVQWKVKKQIIKLNKLKMSFWMQKKKYYNTLIKKKMRSMEKEIILQ